MRHRGKFWQIKWRKEWPNRGLAFGKPSEDQQVASGGIACLLL
jgi:hypothetical protein